MSDKATNYQCPSCTGPLHYDGAAGRLQCDYCGSSFDPAEIEKLYAEKEQQAARLSRRRGATLANGSPPQMRTGARTRTRCAYTAVRPAVRS